MLLVLALIVGTLGSRHDLASFIVGLDLNMLSSIEAFVRLAKSLFERLAQIG